MKSGCSGCSLNTYCERVQSGCSVTHTLKGVCGMTEHTLDSMQFEQVNAER